MHLAYALPQYLKVEMSCDLYALVWDRVAFNIDIPLEDCSRIDHTGADHSVPRKRNMDFSPWKWSMSQRFSGGGTRFKT